MIISGREKGNFCLAEGRHFPPGDWMRRGMPKLYNLQLRVQGAGCFDGL